MSEHESWPRCPEAAAFFAKLFDRFSETNPQIAAMSERFLNDAGVLMSALVDCWTLPKTPEMEAELTACGLLETVVEGECVWEHPQARLPRVRLEETITAPRLAILTESVDAFLEANALTPQSRRGEADSQYEEAVLTLEDGTLVIIARSGYRGFRPGTLGSRQEYDLQQARLAFRERPRSGSEAESLHAVQKLAAEWVERLGAGRAADEFFAAEREFYMVRNRAVQWQYAAQQQLGLGWANHDHHTYRSSRANFRALMALWQTFGFVMRERFYAGEEAGWGAQIVEHPVSRVVIFSDVDMAPDELDIDFSRVDLPPRETLGTIGLWCALHGDSIGAAGMHHLEAEFAFERVQANLIAAGFGVMPPFTDLPMLKQAFTQAESWPVALERTEALRERGLITSEQADRFQAQGAAGSHLEILQRWDGFKGFNKTGVSNIIRDTDARRVKN